jgi:hypothetical protein
MEVLHTYSNAGCAINRLIEYMPNVCMVRYLLILLHHGGYHFSSNVQYLV